MSHFHPRNIKIDAGKKGGEGRKKREERLSRRKK